MLDCARLLGRLDDVKLGTEANALLAVRGDLAIKTGAERFFPREGRGGFGGLAFGGSKSGFRLGYLSRKGAQSERDASALEVSVLQLYEIFDFSLHP